MLHCTVRTYSAHSVTVSCIEPRSVHSASALWSHRDDLQLCTRTCAMTPQRQALLYKVLDAVVEMYGLQTDTLHFIPSSHSPIHSYGCSRRPEHTLNIAKHILPKEQVPTGSLTQSSEEKMIQCVRVKERREGNMAVCWKGCSPSRHAITKLVRRLNTFFCPHIHPITAEQWKMSLTINTPHSHIFGNEREE